VKKIYFAMILTVLAFLVVIGGTRLRAHAQSTTPSIPLAGLAGSFAGQIATNYGRCYNSTFTTLVACSSTTPALQVVPWISNSTIRFTSDTAGDSCGEAIGANAPVAPPPGPAPAGNSDSVLVGTLTSYNATTGSGQNKYKYYTVTPTNGVHCNGFNLVNPHGAPALANATVNFVVSAGGNRLDWIFLNITLASPTPNYISGYVAHAYATRQ
jgi:hypothetical protein